jgi:hypothetical protein
MTATTRTHSEIDSLHDFICVFDIQILAIEGLDTLINHFFRDFDFFFFVNGFGGVANIRFMISRARRAVSSGVL